MTELRGLQEGELIAQGGNFEREGQREDSVSQKLRVL